MTCNPLRSTLSTLAMLTLMLTLLVGCADEAEPPAGEHDAQLSVLLEAYFTTVDALADDDFDAAQAGMGTFRDLLADIEPNEWPDIHPPLREAAQQFVDAADIATARVAFEPVSEQLERAVREFGGSALPSIYVAHCPMAFDDRGADWLQPYRQINNPYFGDEMLRCGNIAETLVE